MPMQLDHEELHRLLATLADSDIQEFRLEGEDFRLEVRRNLSPVITPLKSNSPSAFEEQSPAIVFPQILDSFLANSLTSYSVWTTPGSESFGGPRQRSRAGYCSVPLTFYLLY